MQCQYCQSDHVAGFLCQNSTITYRYHVQHSKIDDFSSCLNGIRLMGACHELESTCCPDEYAGACLPRRHLAVWQERRGPMWSCPKKCQNFWRSCSRAKFLEDLTDRSNLLDSHCSSKRYSRGKKWTEVTGVSRMACASSYGRRF